MEQHPCKQEKEISRIATENVLQQTAIEDRVKWSMFWSILLVIFGILGTVTSNIYSQLDAIVNDEQSFHKDIDTKVSENRISQAKIDVQYVEIQKTLAEIKVTLAKIK